MLVLHIVNLKNLGTTPSRREINHEKEMDHPIDYHCPSDHLYS